jgi:hypothetical protein
VPALSASRDQDTRESSEPHVTRSRWRWLVTGGRVLAVLDVPFCGAVIVASQAGGGNPDRPSQLEVNLVSGPMAVPARQEIWFSG